MSEHSELRSVPANRGPDRDQAGPDPRLIQAGLDLSAHLDFDRVFDLIVTWGGRLTGAEAVRLYLVDWARSEIWTRFGPEAEPVRAPIGRGVAGVVAETGRPVTADNVLHLSYFDPFWDNHHDLVSREVLCLPIRDGQGRVMAVLEAVNKTAGGGFDPRDEARLETFCRQAGAALANATAMQRVNQRLTRMIEISLDLTAELDFDRLFPLIVARTTEIMDADRTSLYLIDWDRGEVWTKVAEQVGEIRLPVGQGISGRVAQTGETVNVVDAWELDYFDDYWDRKHHYRTKSVLCLPIPARNGGRLGVVQVINKKGAEAFSDEDERILKALTNQIAIALENSFLIEELKATFDSFVETLSTTVDAKHPTTAGHSRRVTLYSLVIGRRMGLTESELEVLRYAALFHDIGKIGIPDSVLLKNGPFTNHERRIMRGHAPMTREILDKVRFPQALQQVPRIAELHHERLDGRGYPHGLRGDEIPLMARIMAVADVFDALTSPREYPHYDERQTFTLGPLCLEKAMTILDQGIGNHFDGRVVTTLQQAMPEIIDELNRQGDHNLTPDMIEPGGDDPDTT
jgi:HD-GYP domain-containing protein (c-di-GMP phosphodiesterase class II)